MSVSSPNSNSEVPAKTIHLLKLALQSKNIKLIQCNQKQEVLNLLIQVQDEIDPDQIASMIWAMDTQLKISQVSCVKLYKQVTGKSSPELFSSIDLTELPTSEDNPFSDSTIVDSNLSNEESGNFKPNTSESNSIVNPNLGLKQRAKLGDLPAIKQFLDLALIHKNATTIIRVEGQKLIITIESKRKLDQQTIVMIIKRQLNLLSSSVFSSAEIKAKSSNQVDWIENIHFNVLNFPVKNSDKLAQIKAILSRDKDLTRKIAVACGGIVVLSIVGFFGIYTRLQPPKLYGKYQSEDVEIGYEFMEDNKVAIRSFEGDVLAEYELIKGKNGYKLNIEIFGIGQLFDLKKSGKNLILSSEGDAITFNPVNEFSIITMEQRAIESEAKNYVGVIQRSQQAFRIEQDRFAKSVEELEIGIPLETDNYSYKFHNPSNQLTYFTAQSKTTTLRNFLSGVAVKPNGQTSASSCQSLEPSSTLPTAPTFDGETLQCPKGYEEMD